MSINFKGTKFVLDVTSNKFRTRDSKEVLPKYFPKELVQKYDKEIEKIPLREEFT